MINRNTIKYLLLIITLFALNVGYTENGLSYFHDKDESVSFDNIHQVNFVDYQEPINQGLDNGIFWIKVLSEYKQSIQFKNTHIVDVVAFHEGQSIQPLDSFDFVTFSLNPGVSYLKINANKQAYIPIGFIPEKNILKVEQMHSLIKGLFYGFAFMVLLLNLFFYFSFKDKIFVYYCLFLISIILSFAHRDGVLHILGFSENFTHFSEGFSHFLAGLTGAIFASEYLQLKINAPKFFVSLFIFVFISLLFDVAYLLTNIYLYNALSDVAILYIFAGSWLVALLLSKKYSYALLFCIAYSLIVVLIVDFYIFAAFGWYRIGVDHNILKFGGYFEMLIITAAVVYRMKVLQQENTQMRDQIESYLNKLQSLTIEIDNNNQGKANHFSQYELSHRESEILDLIVQGKGNKLIATNLFISVNTVKYHIKKIYQKLNISSRKEVLSAIA